MDTSKITTVAVNALLLIALILVADSLMEFKTGNELSLELGAEEIAVLIILSSLVFTTSSLCWWTLLKNEGQIPGLIVHAAIQTSALMVSKYIPGKVWGIAARAALAKQLGFSPSKIATIAAYEQLYALLLMLLIGCILVTSSGLTQDYIWVLSGSILLALTFSSTQFLSLVLRHVVNRSAWLPNKIVLVLQDAAIALEGINTKTQVFYLLFTKLNWLGIFSILSILVLNLNNQSELQILDWMQIFGAYALSVLAGFLALFSPGGLVIREAAFCLLVSSILPFELAMKIALSMRLWAVIYDLVFGSIGLLLLARMRQR